jgi:molybdenum cofactor cytidylyltransferase
MTDTMRIVALVLAAGYSSRMGIFKPLAPLGESTPLEQAVARFHRAGVDDVRVVVGHRADDLAPVVERLGARCIFNEDYDRGMFSSVRSGLLSLESDVDAFFLLPADIPLIRLTTIRELLEAFDPSHPGIIYPSFEGERGHPPLISTALLPHDLPEDFPGGLRALLERLEESARDVEVTDQAILMDCDTPSDYQAIVHHWAQGNIPTEMECEAIWSRLGVDESIVAHSSMVAEVARVLTVALNRAGLNLSLPLILAAGRLHDIARDQPDHARAGAQLLANMGHPEVAAVVSTHMDILPNSTGLTEADLLYFADKCVAGDRLVTLEERFGKAMSRHADRPDILKNVSVRLENARTIGRLVESALGSSPYELLQRFERSIRAAAMGAGRRVIYLVRHGAIRPASEPRQYIGQLNLPLLEEGRSQAENLRGALSGVKLSAVYCSDLKRAVDTAQAIAGPHGLSCIARQDLREISLGQWEGMTFDEVRACFPWEFAARGQDLAHYRTPGGESFHDVTLRVIPAFYEILQSTPGNVAIVAHAGVNRVILSQVLGKSLDGLFEIDQDYGCLNVIRHRSQVFEVSLLNDVPSLLS